MIKSIQILRAIAASMVVVHHVLWKCEQYSTNPIRWYTFGAAGVDLFFIISGYIMCLVSSKNEKTFVSFMIARMVRIIPIYWLLSFAALCIFILDPNLVNSSGGNTDVLASFFLYPTEGKYLIQNGWTLSYEFMFYIIFAITLVFCNGSIHLWTVTLAFLFLFLIGTMVETKNYITDYFFSDLFFEFVMGIFAYQMFQNKKKIKPIFSTAFGLSGLVLLITFTRFEDDGYPRALVWGLPMFMIFISVRTLEWLPDTIWNSVFLRMVKSIGDSSYSLYLLHPFVLAGLAVLLKDTAIVLNGFAFGFVLIVTSLIAGWVCYCFLEKPSIYITKKMVCLVYKNVVSSK